MLSHCILTIKWVVSTSCIWDRFHTLVLLSFRYVFVRTKREGGPPCVLSLSALFSSRLLMLAYWLSVDTGRFELHLSLCKSDAFPIKLPTHILRVGLGPTISRLSAECINLLCYRSKKFPRRESHSLEPKGTGFTDPPAYFNGLLRNKTRHIISCMYQFCYSRNLWREKWDSNPYNTISINCCLCLKYSQRDSNS